MSDESSDASRSDASSSEATGPHAQVNPCVTKLLDEAVDAEFEKGFKWLEAEHSDKFLKRCEKAEDLVGDLEPELPLDAKGTSLGELALQEPLKYKKCTVYLVGTDHDTRKTAEEIRMVADQIKPDIILAEHPKDWPEEDMKAMTEAWVQFDGNVEKMAAAYLEKEDKAFCANMRKAGHVFKGEKYSDQLLKWGTFQSVDVGMCALIAHKLSIPCKWIDITEHAHDTKFGPVWDHVAMHLCMKKIFGVNCLDNGCEIGNVYQLLAATRLQPVHIMRIDQEIEATVASGIHSLGTHTRDLYMQYRIQQWCDTNPGKTVLAVMGAFHSLNIRDHWQYKIPQSLAQCVEKASTSKKQMDKTFRKFGGRMLGQAKDCDYKKFPKW